MSIRYPVDRCGVVRTLDIAAHPQNVWCFAWPFARSRVQTKVAVRWSAAPN